MIVGTATIETCTLGDDWFEWNFAKVVRLAQPIKPTRQPQPVWFEPF